MQILIGFREKKKKNLGCVARWKVRGWPQRESACIVSLVGPLRSLGVEVIH